MNRHQRRANTKLLVPRHMVAQEQRNGVMVHELIQRVAKEAAQMFYDAACTKSNNMYKAFPNEADFVATQWPDFIGHAKAKLTEMLTLPGVPEDQKEFIYDALCLDRTLPKSQSRGLN